MFEILDSREAIELVKNSGNIIIIAPEEKKSYKLTYRTKKRYMCPTLSEHHWNHAERYMQTRNRKIQWCGDKFKLDTDNNLDWMFFLERDSVTNQKVMRITAKLVDDILVVYKVTKTRLGVTN